MMEEREKIYIQCKRKRIWLRLLLMVFRASKRNLARRNKTTLGSRGHAQTSLEIEDFKQELAKFRPDGQ
jgi:hypothetical protein